MPHVNMVGTLTTAGHGGSAFYPILGEKVTKMEMMTVDGNLLKLKSNKTKDFKRYLTHLGGIGIITKLTM